MDKEQEKVITTYVGIAKDEGLTGKTAERFVKYMTIRWKDSEAVKCQVGYASEWAMRFKNGYEYNASDSIGQEILRSSAFRACT